MTARLEVCVDTLAGLSAARAGGADRVEVCDALCEGGLTPSAMAIHAALGLGLDVVAMIRPRGGDFVYAEAEAEAMLRDVGVAKAAGVGGVALGALTPAGDVDAELVAALVAAARPMEVCFHRAFDHARAPGEALEALIALGVDRVLTAGGAESAEAGLDALRALAARAGERVAVMPGGGVRPHNAAAILAATGARELHSSARGPDGRVDVATVRALARAAAEARGW